MTQATTLGVFYTPVSGSVPNTLGAYHTGIYYAYFNPDDSTINVKVLQALPTNQPSPFDGAQELIAERLGIQNQDTPFGSDDRYHEVAVAGVAAAAARRGNSRRW
jgi:hypothetical protein